MNLYKINSENKLVSYNLIHFNNPNKIFIPIQKDISFRGNDYIYKNTYFNNYISSVSGKVVGTKKIKMNNVEYNTIVIENDFKENSKTKRNKRKLEDKNDLINVFKINHFNTYIDRIKEIDNIKNLVVTCVEKDPNSFTELSYLSNYSEEILDTISLLHNILKIKNNYLSLNNTYYDAIKNVNSKIGSYPEIKSRLLPDLYLIDRKEFLCEYLNLKKEETIIFSSKEIYDIYVAIKKFRDVTEQIITINGNILESSIVIKTRLYVSIKEIIKTYLPKIDGEYNLFINGLLDGYISNSDHIITKDVHTITLNKKEDNMIYHCINCGACEKICPYNINAKLCYFTKMHHRKCISCGLCNYICPSNINLKEVVGGNNEKI